MSLPSRLLELCAVQGELERAEKVVALRQSFDEDVSLQAYQMKSKHTPFYRQWCRLSPDSRVCRPDFYIQPSLLHTPLTLIWIPQTPDPSWCVFVSVAAVLECGT